MNIIFKVSELRMSCFNAKEIPSGSVNILIGKFICDSDWDALDKRATFLNKKTNINKTVPLDINNECYIPWEVIKDDGEMEVTLFGSALINGIDKRAKSSLEEPIIVRVNGGVEGDDPTQPTPDLINLIANQASAAEASAKRAEDVAAAAIEINKGDDGFSPTIEITPIGDKYEVKFTDKNQTQIIELFSGVQGKSAYEVALETGYTGTKEQWLLSLRGDKGDSPIKGVDYFDGAPGPQGPKGDVGPQGPPGAEVALGETNTTAYAGDKGKKVTDDLLAHVGSNGSSHSLATSTVAGFISPDEKNKLASLEMKEITVTGETMNISTVITGGGAPSENTEVIIGDSATITQILQSNTFYDIDASSLCTELNLILSDKIIGKYSIYSATIRCGATPPTFTPIANVTWNADFALAPNKITEINIINGIGLFYSY